MRILLIKGFAVFVMMLSFGAAIAAAPSMTFQMFNFAANSPHRVNMFFSLSYKNNLNQTVNINYLMPRSPVGDGQLHGAYDINVTSTNPLRFVQDSTNENNDVGGYSYFCDPNDPDRNPCQVTITDTAATLPPGLNLYSPVTVTVQYADPDSDAPFKDSIQVNWTSFLGGMVRVNTGKVSNWVYEASDNYYVPASGQHFLCGNFDLCRTW